MKTIDQTWLLFNLPLIYRIAQAGGEAGKLLRSLQDQADQWRYFLDHPKLPPDNNLAERTLRLAVTNEKSINVLVQ